MSLSLDDVIKKIVESEKEKNNSIEELRLRLERNYEKFVASKNEEKSQALKEIDEEYTKIISKAKEDAKKIIDSAEDRKSQISNYYSDLEAKNKDLAEKIANLLFR